MDNDTPTCRQRALRSVHGSMSLYQAKSHDCSVKAAQPGLQLCSDHHLRSSQIGLSCAVAKPLWRLSFAAYCVQVFGLCEGFLVCESSQRLWRSLWAFLYALDIEKRTSGVRLKCRTQRGRPCRTQGPALQMLLQPCRSRVETNPIGWKIGAHVT